jgi:pimeloyl-ACP methyl ester carboxylesterase
MIEKFLFYAALLAALWLFFRWFERHNVYFPFRAFAGTPDEIGLKFQDVSFAAPDGVNLHGWYLPADGARFTLLLSHGNGGNVSHRIGKLLLLHRLGANVFIYDYRGYGRSEGRPSEAGTYRDALAACDWLQAHKGAAPGRIIAYGRRNRDASPRGWRHPGKPVHERARHGACHLPVAAATLVLHHTLRFVVENRAAQGAPPRLPQSNRRNRAFRARQDAICRSAGA